MPHYVALVAARCLIQWFLLRVSELNKCEFADFVAVLRLSFVTNGRDRVLDQMNQCSVKLIV